MCTTTKILQPTTKIMLLCTKISTKVSTKVCTKISPKITLEPLISK
jgi:hypothetical protein